MASNEIVSEEAEEREYVTNPKNQFRLVDISESRVFELQRLKNILNLTILRFYFNIVENRQTFLLFKELDTKPTCIVEKILAEKIHFQFGQLFLECPMFDFF